VRTSVLIDNLDDLVRIVWNITTKLVVLRDGNAGYYYFPEISGNEPEERLSSFLKELRIELNEIERIVNELLVRDGYDGWVR